MDASPVLRHALTASMDRGSFLVGGFRLMYGYFITDDTLVVVEPLIGVRAGGERAAADTSVILAEQARLPLAGKSGSRNAEFDIGAGLTAIQYFGRSWGLPFVPFISGRLSTTVGARTRAQSQSATSPLNIGDRSSAASLDEITGSLSARLGGGVEYWFSDVLSLRLALNVLEGRVDGARSISNNIQHDIASSLEKSDWLHADMRLRLHPSAGLTFHF